MSQKTSFNKILFIGVVSSFVVLAMHAIILTVFFGDNPTLQGVGQITGSGIAALAFVWLIVSQFLVLTSIRHQQHSLLLQERSLKHQVTALKRAQEDNSSQLFVITLDFAIGSLSRYCESFLVVSRAEVSENVTFTNSEFSRKDTMATIVMRNEEVLTFLEGNAKSPIVSDLIQSYLKLYSQIRDIAEQSNSNLNLFDIALKNSAFDQLAAFLKKVN